MVDNSINRVRENLAQAFRAEAERLSGQPLTMEALQHQLGQDLRYATLRRRRIIPRHYASGVILSDDVAAMDQDPKDYAGISYNPLTRIVKMTDSPEVRLWPTEGLLFHPMIAYPERILLNTTALDILQYPDFSRIRNVIYRMRPKINDELIGGTTNDPEFKYLQTIPHTGYMLKVNPKA